MKRLVGYISPVQGLFIFYLLGILYFICPLQIYGYRIQHIFQLCYILWTLILIINDLLKKRFQFDRMIILMVCFYVWCWITFILQPKPHGIIPFIHLLTLLMFLALIFRIGSEHDPKELDCFLVIIFKLVIIMTVFLNILSIGYYFFRGVLPFPDFINDKFNFFSGRNDTLRYAGIYFHPVLAGEKCFLSIVFSILLYKDKKISQSSMVVTLASSGIMLLLADSRTAYLQLLFVSTVAVYQFLKFRTEKRFTNRILFISSATFIMIFLCFLFQFNKQIPFDSLNRFSSNRLIIWKTAISEAAKRPWLGWGWENGDSIVMYTQSGIDNCHNILINLLLWTGIPGLVLFLGICLLWATTVIKNWETLKRSNYHWLAIITITLYIQALLDILIIGEDIRVGTPFFWLLAGITYYAANKPVINQTT